MGKVICWRGISQLIILPLTHKLFNVLFRQAF
ncbi:unnamed protein product, partial [marine sediment metagenome]